MADVSLRFEVISALRLFHVGKKKVFFLNNSRVRVDAAVRHIDSKTATERGCCGWMGVNSHCWVFVFINREKKWALSMTKAVKLKMFNETPAKYELWVVVRW